MFLLFQNQNIVSGTRWIVQVDVSEEPGPQLVAQIREFETELQAREFSQREEGVLVPGKCWVLKFAGVCDDTYMPFTQGIFDSANFFLQEAAIWLSQRG